MTADDSYMYAADEDGYVYVHDIQNYALQDTKEETPKCMCICILQLCIWNWKKEFLKINLECIVLKS